MDYLGDGITESLINSLSQVPHLSADFPKLCVPVQATRTRRPGRRPVR